MDGLINRIKNRFKGGQDEKKKKQVLCYHSVGPAPHFQSKFHWVGTDGFTAKLEQLVKNGFSFLPIDEFLKESGRHKKIVSITFDDGYKDVIDYAVPILDQMEIPATIFLCSEIVSGKVFWRDKVRYLMDHGLNNDFQIFTAQNIPEIGHKITWDNFYKSTKNPSVHSGKLDYAIDDFLNAKGIEVELEIYLDKSDLNDLPNVISIGNHTRDHFILSSLGKQEQAVQIEECQNFIKTLTPNPSQVFCIPFGDYHSFDQNTLDLLNEMDFNGFVMTNEYNTTTSLNSLGRNPYDLLYSNRILPKN